MNRRALLTSIAAVAAAAVGTRVPEAQAAESGRPMVPPGDVHIDSYWKGWDEGNVLANGLIAQARADGYNRRGEIEAARIESRTQDSEGR